MKNILHLFILICNFNNYERLNNVSLKKQETNLKKYISWHQIVLISTIGWIVVWINRTALTPIYPALSKFFGGATDAEIGAITSFYFLGYVLMQIPSGLLVDRFGKKKVLLPGFAIFGLGTFIMASSHTLPIIYLGNILAGIGSGTFYGVAFSLTNEYVPIKHRSVATAIVNCGTAIGSAAGMIGSSYFVAQKGMPWQYTEYFSFITILIMIGLFWKFLPKDDHLNTKTLASEIENLEQEENKLSMKKLFSAPMIGAYAIYFATCYAYYLINTWLPNFLETERGFEGSTIGLASSLIFFSSIPGAIIFSRIADNYSHRKIEIVVLLEILAVLSLTLSVAATNKPLLIIGLLLYGFFGKVAVEPIIISWLGDTMPHKGLATTLGVFNFLGMSSSVIAPTLTGQISDLTGSKITAFYIAIIIVIIGTLLFYLVNRRKHIQGSEEIV